MSQLIINMQKTIKDYGEQIEKRKQGKGSKRGS